MKFRKYFPAAVALSLFALAGAPVVRGQDTKLRWDLISIQFRAPSAPNIVSAGGNDSAVANNAAGMPRLRIKLTGSGTFSQWDSTDVTGGGDYVITTPQGTVVDSGTYTVTQLISWALDSVQLPVNVNNVTNGAPEDFRNGLAIFRIAYSDGSKGVLIVSCAGPGASEEPYEGISVTKGKVHFQIPDVPVANVDANRTVFTVLR
jgi:hypothetical protein